MPTTKTELTIEKLKIHERLLLIEQYILEGKEQRGQINETMNNLNLRCTNIENMIHGEKDHEDKKIRDGMNRRMESLEDRDDNSKKIKNQFLKIAVGSITMSVGAFVLWLCKLIWSSTGK